MNWKQIKPLSDRVLIQPAEVETKTASGIIIPETAQGKPLRGIVLNVGDEVKQIEPGDEVLYGKFAGSEIKADDLDDTLTLMRETDVQCIIKPIKKEK